MNKEIRQFDKKTCYIYASQEAEYLLVQPVDDHDLEGLDHEVELIAKQSDRHFTLVAFKIDDWNKELSPWSMKALFGNDDFGDGARSTLEYTKRLIETIKKEYSLNNDIKVILGGYSLAGLFSLYASYYHEFYAINAASPSVWFKDWMKFAQDNKTKSKHIYLSLGTKEEKARNPIMATVGDCIRTYHDHLLNETDSVLEWNNGNHFFEPDVRTAKGFIHLLNK